MKEPETADSAASGTAENRIAAAATRPVADEEPAAAAAAPRPRAPAVGHHYRCFSEPTGVPAVTPAIPVAAVARSSPPSPPTATGRGRDLCGPAAARCLTGFRHWRWDMPSPTSPDISTADALSPRLRKRCPDRGNDCSRPRRVLSRHRRGEQQSPADATPQGWPRQRRTETATHIGNTHRAPHCRRCRRAHRSVSPMGLHKFAHLPTSSPSVGTRESRKESVM